MLALMIAAGLLSQGAADPGLGASCDAACASAVSEFESKGLHLDQVAAGIAILDRAKQSFRFGSARGAQAFYPASVVKLFFLAYAADCLAHGRVKETEEFDRGVRDMIRESVNDAAAYVLETTTGATSGPELPPTAMKKWTTQRLAINRWFAAMGYEGVNACNRTWNEGPYGRERAFLGPDFQNRNSLTLDSCVRLMSEIALGTALRHDLASGESDKWCSWMKGFLLRTIPADDPKADFQSKAFIGEALPSGSHLWSKAGYTDTVRHDVAYVRLPNERELVIAVFTKGSSQIPDLIPSVARRLLDSVQPRQTW